MKKWMCALLVLSAPLLADSQMIQELVYKIRNPATEAEQFRISLETIGEFLAADVLEVMPKEERTIQTLTGEMATHFLVTETPALVTILRAGLPLNAGIQKVFPQAPVGFIAMARNEETLKAEVSYVALPEMTDKIVIISDTMLATGGSLLEAIQIIEQRHPKEIILISAIASQAGIARIKEHNPMIKIFAAAIDPSLNDHGYILPGLGDAGDRSYGVKR